MDTQNLVPVPALVVFEREYRIRCDITYIRSDGSVRTIECTTPIGRGGSRLGQVYNDLDSAEAALDCAIDAGKDYEEHIAHMAKTYPNIYDKVIMHNYRISCRECTEWHTLSQAD